MKILVTKILLQRMDPTGTLWSVSVVDPASMWKETFGSRIEVDAFIRGARAESSMSASGYVSVEVKELPDVEVNNGLKKVVDE